MAEIKNPEAYFGTMVRNMDKNDFRANDNYFKHFDSVGDETDIRRKINDEKGNDRQDAYSIESSLCESSLENWLLLLENEGLHKALRALKHRDIDFIFSLATYKFNCKKYATAHGLSKQSVAKRFSRLKVKIKKLMEKGCPK